MILKYLLFSSPSCVFCGEQLQRVEEEAEAARKTLGLQTEEDKKRAQFADELERKRHVDQVHNKRTQSHLYMKRPIISVFFLAATLREGLGRINRPDSSRVKRVCWCCAGRSFQGTRRFFSVVYFPPWRCVYAYFLPRSSRDRDMFLFASGGFCQQDRSDPTDHKVTGT